MFTRVIASNAGNRGWHALTEVYCRFRPDRFMLGHLRGSNLPWFSSMSFARGFTLIEMVAVLLLVGILGAFATVGINQSVRAYIIATENAHMAQKSQLALTRLGLELADCREGCVGPVPGIVVGSEVGEPSGFNFRNTQGERRISLADGRILLGPSANPEQQRVLVDGVTALRIERVPNPIDGMGQLFQIGLSLAHVQTGVNINFQTRVYYER